MCQTLCKLPPTTTKLCVYAEREKYFYFLYPYSSNNIFLLNYIITTVIIITQLMEAT